MRPMRGPALQIDLRKGKEAVRRRPLALTYPQLILVAIAFAVMMTGIRQLSPTVALTIELGLAWVLGLCALTVFGIVWKLREDRVVSMRHLVLAIGLTALLLARAALETYRALG